MKTMSGRLRRGALLGWLAVAAPALGAGPEVSLRLVEHAGWSRGATAYHVSQPELFLDLGQRPFEQLELSLRAAVILGQWLVPVDGTVDALVRWTPGGWAAGEGVWAQLSPLGSTRLKFGFDPLLQVDSWGPGVGAEYPYVMAVGLSREQWRAQMVVKSVQVHDSFTDEDERWHSVFVEGEWSSPRHWNVAVAGAYLPGGQMDFGGQMLIEENATLAGAVRVTYRSAGEIGAPLDLERLARVPWSDEALFAPAASPRPPLGVEVVVEGLLGDQRELRPLPPVVGGPSRRLFGGGHASVRASMNNTRFQLGGAWRPIGFLVAQTRVPLSAALAFDPLTYDDFWLEGSADLELPGTGFTPGVVLRVRRPGGLTIQVPGAVTLTYDPLALTADNSPPRAGWNVTLTGRWMPWPSLGLLAVASYDYDPNLAEIREVEPGLFLPVPVSPNLVSLGVTAQLGF
ncbi:MAG TPA: hypothetical protein VFA20_21750 [Myxococcaceae bacterium]|nr:hypothetical protein [Myxococcaceae bacterium]